ncbi:hypothetical protein BSKO_04762 [Bryopsis sp. KO-2023]|nr:hypothetical protein BSKO_04762 [Bryopsis sp. KO-2023]
MGRLFLANFDGMSLPPAAFLSSRIPPCNFALCGFLPPTPNRALLVQERIMNSLHATSSRLALGRATRVESSVKCPRVVAQRLLSTGRRESRIVFPSLCRAEAGESAAELESIMDAVEGGSSVADATPEEAPATSEASDAETAAAASTGSEVSDFSLNFLWLDRNVAVAVDHHFGSGMRSPLTEYFFWPRTDAWEELKASLETKPWISERDKVLLLNKTTEVINFWQDETTKHTLSEAQEAFEDCVFYGN